MAEHTIKAFDEEIDRLRGLIAEMGGRAEAAIENAMLALQRQDQRLAAEVVADDKRIDALEAEVEKLVVQIIALRAPMANDLRDVIAALKIVSVVERIGDYAKNIAKRVPLIAANQHKLEPVSLLPSMGQVAAEMVHDVLNAFAARDAELALAVVERDQVVDDFYDSVFRTLVTYMSKIPRRQRVRAPAVHRQEYRTHRRPCDQCRGNGLLCRNGQTLPERERGGTQQQEN